MLNVARTAEDKRSLARGWESSIRTIREEGRGMGDGRAMWIVNAWGFSKTTASPI
jgi:hypothetical protein